MITLLETIAIALRLAVASSQDAQRQEEALKTAEERLALMRKRARYAKPEKKPEDV